MNKFLGTHTSYDNGTFKAEKRNPGTRKIEDFLQIETRQYGK